MQDEFELGHKSCSCFKATLHTEGQHTAETVLEILASKIVILIALKTRIIYALHSRMLLKELCHSKSVLTATLSSERKSLKTLKHEERVERRSRRTDVAETVHTYATCKGSITKYFLIYKTMIAF